MRTVRYHPAARAEFLQQIDYYATINARLAEHYARAVRSAEAQAAAAPEAWPKYTHNTRRVVDRRFRFSLVYRHRENEIHVIAVAPIRRRPGYWTTPSGGARLPRSP